MPDAINRFKTEDGEQELTAMTGARLEPAQPERLYARVPDPHLAFILMGP